jgi:hypothetical protein
MVFSGIVGGVPFDSKDSTTLSTLIWYGMVWYGMVWYGMLCYCMVWYGVVWYDMARGMVDSTTLSTLISTKSRRCQGRSCERARTTIGGP